MNRCRGAFFRSFFRVLCLSCAMLWGGPERILLAETTLAEPESVEEVVEMFRDRPLEEKKQLAYLYARLGNRLYAEPIARMVLAEDPGDQRILLAMASMYLTQRDAERTMEFAQRILEQFPNNRDGLYFLAAANTLSGRNERAAKILRDLERLYPASMRFPFELDLASASSLSGDWYQAIQSYQKILKDGQMAPELRMSARRALDALYREHLPSAGIEVADIDAGTGSIREVGARVSAPVSRRFRLEVAGAFFETGIDPTVTTTADTSDTRRVEADLLVDAGPQYSFRLSGRAFDGKGGYGAAIRREARGGSSQEISWDTQLRATDSLNLLYLGGAEDRLNLFLAQPLPAALLFRGNAYYRQVNVGGGRLGDGWGADWELIYPLPVSEVSLFLSWRGAYSRMDIRSADTGLAAGLPYLPQFGPTPETVEGLSAERTHREGLAFLVSKDLSGKWNLSTNVGFDYYLYLREFTWYAGTSVRFRPIKSIDVLGDVSYSSADNRGDESSEYLLLSLEIVSRF